jgi:hypothetical protein
MILNAIVSHTDSVRHVGRVLPRAVENAEVLRAARAGAVLRRWDEAVGPLLSEKSVPDRYDKGTVWVATQGSAWAQELRLMKPIILERLESMAGERGMFLDIRFGVRPPRAPRGFDVEEASLPTERPERTEPPEVPKPIIAPVDTRKEDEAWLSIRERAARRLANWPKNE